METPAATETEEPFPRPDRLERHRRRHRWYTRPLVVIAAVTAVAGGLRFYRLSDPHEYVFDETYYAKDGCLVAGYRYQECKLDSPAEQTVTVHPPLGRLIIAASEKIWGNRPFGWRAASAIFGTLSVLMVAILALRLFGSALWAGVAGLLLATENLHFVQSRMSMLDIFVATFVLAGFLFLVLDREWIERRSPPPPETPEDLLERRERALLDLPPDRPPSPIFRPWRLAAGLAFGGAVASKWSGAPALLGAVVLTLMWERGRRRQAGLDHPLWSAVRDESFGVFVFLAVIPLASYVAAYIPWFIDHGGLKLADWFSLQHQMESFSSTLRATHPYSSPAWGWLLITRPVAYFYKGNAANTMTSAIYDIGNPAVFWGSVLALPYLLLQWVRRRDWRAGLILLAFGFQYAFWFFFTRTDFFFYMTPMTPFLVLAGVYGLRDIASIRVAYERVPAYAWVAGLLVFMAVGLFVFFLPVLTGRTISYTQWRARIWFACKPVHAWCQWNWF